MDFHTVSHLTIANAYDFSFLERTNNKKYIRGSKDYGTVALAKKYDVSQNTIWRTINGNYR